MKNPQEKNESQDSAMSKQIVESNKMVDKFFDLLARQIARKHLQQSAQSSAEDKSKKKNPTK